MINWVKFLSYNVLILILYISLIIFAITVMNSVARLLLIDYAYSDTLYRYEDNQIFLESLEPEEKAETSLLSSEEMTEKRLKTLEYEKLRLKSRNFSSIVNNLTSLISSGIMLLIMRRLNKNAKNNDAK